MSYIHQTNAKTRLRSCGLAASYIRMNHLLKNYRPRDPKYKSLVSMLMSDLAGTVDPTVGFAVITNLNGKVLFVNNSVEAFLGHHYVSIGGG